jgi:hypothetical protein
VVALQWRRIPVRVQRIPARLGAPLVAAQHFKLLRRLVPGIAEVLRLLRVQQRSDPLRAC